jgi:hypothetical protein
MTELSKVRPDRDALVQQLTDALDNSQAWKDRTISSTGRTLIDLVAAIGANSQYSIESSYQEVWPESAKTREALYAASNYLGVRYNRKLPAALSVSLSSTTYPKTIPQFTQFTIQGTLWFNRDALTLTAPNGVFTLYQGKVVTNTVNGLGTDFQAYVTPESGFTVSDIDVNVEVNGTAVASILRGLWTVKGEPGVQHFTLPAGQCIFLFGNDTNGTKPGINDTVKITYAVTFGADGNNLPVLNQKVFTNADATITGLATVVPSAGANETDAFVYKNITPALSGSFDSSITPAQYKALPLQYPGVIDAQTFAQREINPKALTWMNNIRVVLLTATPYNDAQWASFVLFMTNKTMYKCQLIRKDPVPTIVNVAVNVFCTNFAKLSDVKAKVESALHNLFAPRQGILGFDFYRSDIIRVVEDADPNVEYCILLNPVTDIILSSLNVPAPTLAKAAPFTSPSLPVGVYDYAVSVVSSLGGETAPANWSTTTVTVPNSRITITWPSVPNALSYRVWGRITGNNLGLLATIPATSTRSFTDTGGVSPTGSVPVEATIGSTYAKLGTLTVNVAFSTRPQRIG